MYILLRHESLSYYLASDMYKTGEHTVSSEFMCIKIRLRILKKKKVVQVEVYKNVKLKLYYA